MTAFLAVQSSAGSLFHAFGELIGVNETTITSQEFLQAIGETLKMVGISLFLGALIGIPVGILLVLTRPGGMCEKKVLYAVLNTVINIIRSLPFIVLMVAIIPFTRLIVHTSIGTNAAIVPLVIFVAPYIGRLVENSLLDVSPGILEAAQSMGATMFEIIRYFLLPEAIGSLILALTTATIGLIGATAMAGTVGGGGIGDLAVSYGYERFDRFVMITTVVVLIAFVQGLQTWGNRLAYIARRE
ncbi:methionine ABC transporter permease [Ethanoligenens harbinense]|uniref:Binding-protein-dependent transport systems inner membrane component n=1 Tax=Ethanoligenens harbinense (strain DSM 18485 / JCM 12961 / CGMCC 1.5033 / YUAN-3) TaxID=663278 RepID=E6U995_ETHHY|nr:methionine ABC transporter permease [Ethanoligenens harbinense]ADU27254.1 binding-protein-dependent transport systems inner membrane component [Ethanoligenens harbinense YUAN-3]AVQ96320.1 ABC transporter permease [Ethanoligenens harbinense YUAN-3]AYF38978.1 ABC transporter permease [Ethanoligenens harbinense]AYF41731.1 ABC transporter permease [Ethanoligenens harbinense]QCN92561.1 ABC transporter permease [Ethanoligenens harbinense]